MTVVGCRYGPAMRIERTMNRTEGTSTVEPALDPEWPESKRLDWKRSLQLHDAGLWSDLVSIEAVDGAYNLTSGRSTWGPMSYQQAWDFLNGLGAGVELGRWAASRG